MYLPTFAHPYMHRDGTVTYVLCTPGCFITETDYDLEWHAGKGLLWKRQIDGSQEVPNAD